jgi:hypothetical protein
MLVGGALVVLAHGLASVRGSRPGETGREKKLANLTRRARLQVITLRNSLREHKAM